MSSSRRTSVSSQLVKSRSARDRRNDDYDDYEEPEIYEEAKDQADDLDDLLDKLQLPFSAPRPKKDAEMDEPWRVDTERQDSAACPVTVDEGRNCWKSMVWRDPVTNKSHPLTCAEACLRPENIDNYLRGIQRNIPSVVQIKSLDKVKLAEIGQVEIELGRDKRYVYYYETEQWEDDVNRRRNKPAAPFDLVALRRSGAVTTLKYTLWAYAEPSFPNLNTIIGYIKNSLIRVLVNNDDDKLLFLPNTAASWKYEGLDQFTVNSRLEVAIKFSKTIHFPALLRRDELMD